MCTPSILFGPHHYHPCQWLPPSSPVPISLRAFLGLPKHRAGWGVNTPGVALNQGWQKLIRTTPPSFALGWDTNFQLPQLSTQLITFSLVCPMLIFFPSCSHLYFPISASWVHLSIQLLTLKSSFPGLLLGEPNLQHISYTKQYSLKKALHTAYSNEIQIFCLCTFISTYPIIFINVYLKIIYYH